MQRATATPISATIATSEGRTYQSCQRATSGRARNDAAKPYADSAKKPVMRSTRIEAAARAVRPVRRPTSAMR
jgi:hypothetical protein